MNGVLAINKSAGFTSHDVVNCVRKLYRTKKVGHAGTLDPMATGVLPILVGNAVKASQFVADSHKVYRARMRLGLLTDTEDITGRVVKTDPNRPTLFELQKAAQGFVGTYYQVPPMYSALKVGGKKLYELARQNQVVERTARPVTIHSASVSPTEDPDEFWVEVSCSKGTYIRTFLVDLAQRCSALATMTALERTYCGGFGLEQSYTLDRLRQMEDPQQLSAFLVPTQALFSHLPQVRLPAFYYRLAQNGQPIYASRARLSLPDVGELLQLCSPEGEFFALAQVQDSQEGLCACVLKQFPN